MIGHQVKPFKRYCNSIKPDSHYKPSLQEKLTPLAWHAKGGSRDLGTSAEINSDLLQWRCVWTSDSALPTVGYNHFLCQLKSYLPWKKNPMNITRKLLQAIMPIVMVADHNCCHVVPSDNSCFSFWALPAGNSSGSTAIKQCVLPSHQIMLVALTKKRTNIPIARNLIGIHHSSLNQPSTKPSCKTSCSPEALERLWVYNHAEELSSLPKEA